MTDRFRPDAALRGITPPVDRGLSRRVAFSPPTYHSEVNKDRTGKHGSEVA